MAIEIGRIDSERSLFSFSVDAQISSPAIDFSEKQLSSLDQSVAEYAEHLVAILLQNSHGLTRCVSV